jgi:hypothetical protein
MQFHRPILLHLITLAAAFLFCSAGDAAAKRRGFTLITTGSTHSELGPIKKDAAAGLAPEMKSEIQQRNYDTVGYQYSHFGIFWLDLWNWSGEYIVYNKVSEDGAVAPQGVAAALLGVEEAKLPKPLNYRFPYGLMIICGLVSLKVVPRLIAKRKSRQPLPPFNPPPPSGGGDRPRWTPLAPQTSGSPAQMPTAPLPSAGPPPVPPPLPPES